jgi:L-Ala-D/L-Glu epimerase
MKVSLEPVDLPLARPFAITGHTFTCSRTVRVTLETQGVVGRGEGLGMYYFGETQQSMLEQLNAALDCGLDSDGRERLQALLPHGGARNALDCALWDLECKRSGRSIWQLLKLKPRTLATVFTIGLDEPERMASAATEARDAMHLKIKLDADRPVERMRAIRLARPDATLVVDVNQGWSMDELREYSEAASGLDIAMIEQPLPRGADEALEDFDSPVPLAGDESCLHSGELAQAARRYDIVNIKLDKTGGLTEALKLAKMAKAAGLDIMVGNMLGSSLSMAPSYVIGQFCRFVDIDGPLLLAGDVEHGLTYGQRGIVGLPRPELWG